MNIRKGTVSDLAQVLELVKQLAIYEKEPEAVTATLQDYINDFNENIFDFFVAEKEAKIVGIALYYLAYSTWKGKMMYLDDIVVVENYRRLGIGKLLFEALLVEAKEKKVKLLKWQVLNWNQLAINFYNKYPVEFEDNWLNVKIFMQ